MTTIGKDTKRPIVIIYINGLLLVVIKLESMSARCADITNSYGQIKNYQYDIKESFVYKNTFNIISYFTNVLGTITSGKKYFFSKAKEWDYKKEKRQYVIQRTLMRERRDSRVTKICKRVQSIQCKSPNRSEAIFIKK